LLHPAGWDCESCRRQGLERTGRCGYLPPRERGEPRLVWIHGDAVAEECPKSAVTGRSAAWVESFALWKSGGTAGPVVETARDAEAMAVLGMELEKARGEGRV
jgi:hypothetical protein